MGAGEWEWNRLFKKLSQCFGKDVGRDENRRDDSVWNIQNNAEHIGSLTRVQSRLPIASQSNCTNLVVYIQGS